MQYDTIKLYKCTNYNDACRIVHYKCTINYNNILCIKETLFTQMLEQQGVQTETNFKISRHKLLAKFVKRATTS